MARLILCFLMITGFYIKKSVAQKTVPIQTDRPDQTECPFIVAKKHIQFESGANFEKVDEREQNFIHPTLLTRIGVNNIFEFRLITEYYSTKFENKKYSELSPVKVGFKTKLSDENGLVPATAFIAHLTIPDFSSGTVSPRYFAPDFRFTMQHTLNSKITFSYNLGAQWDGDEAEPEFIYTITSGFSLTEKTGAYIEMYGFLPQKSKGDHRCDGGFTYFLKNNIMMDISGGLGITQNSPQFYTSLGFSVRLPD